MILEQINVRKNFQLIKFECENSWSMSLDVKEHMLVLLNVEIHINNIKKNSGNLRNVNTNIYQFRLLISQ